MIERFAGGRPGYARNQRGRHMWLFLAWGTLGALVACSFSSVLAPAPPATASPPASQGTGETPEPLRPGATPTPPPSATSGPTDPTNWAATVTRQDVRTGPSATSAARLPQPGLEATATDRSPLPTPQPTVTATDSPPTATRVRSDLSTHTGQVTLPTYPYQDFLREEVDATYGMTVLRLDRRAYEGAAPSPSPKSYQTLVVENAHLRLTFLPELGGRLYSTLIKATGQEVFYHNPVVKPSRYGPLLPIEDNWWLAVGGMEWAFPVHEHGYAWGLPWTYELAGTDQAVTVTLRDSIQSDRVRAEVRITLPADSGTFSIQPRLINGTDRTLPIQFWLDAALAPGGHELAPGTRIVVPASQVVIHSRGETGWELPGARLPLSWPVAAGRNLSHYDQWADYLGFFIPYMQASFMGVYAPGADLGVARVVPPGLLAGHKLFAFGLNFSDRGYTDDNSQYIEIWGGANRAFWPEDDILLAPGDTLEWREVWWPLAGLGGLDFANEQVAFNLSNDSRLRILSARPVRATLVLLNGGEIARTSLSLSPSTPVDWSIPASSNPFRLQFFAPDGGLMADYQTSQYPVGSTP